MRVLHSSSKRLLRADTPDVFKALAIKAKSGDNAAMRLVFEIAGELGKTDKEEYEGIRVELISRAEEALMALRPEQSQDELVRRLKVSNP